MQVVWAVLVLMVARGAGATSFAQPPWPGLSAAALTQLQTAADGERPDEPALYPLLLHMRSWDAASFAAARAALLPGDVGVCLSAPADFRGAPFGLEARFAGRVREVELLRGGPWGRTVTEWGLVFDGPEGAPGRVAVLYFPCAPEQLGRPRDRQRVRVVGRFFKTWTDVVREQHEHFGHDHI